MSPKKKGMVGCKNCHNRADLNKLHIPDLSALCSSSGFLSPHTGPKHIKQTAYQSDGTREVMLHFRCCVERDRPNV